MVSLQRNSRVMVWLGVLLSGCLWLIFLSTRGGVLPDLCSRLDSIGTLKPIRCIVGYNVQADKYCVIDPTCASPLFRTTWIRAVAQTDITPQWEGLAWLPDGFAPVNIARTFSWVSLALFDLLIVLPAILLSLLKRRPVTVFIISALLTWYALEVLRWWYTFESFGGLYGDEVKYDQPITWLLVLAILAPFVLAVLLFRRRLGEQAGEPTVSHT